jgi:hypothetical protein
MIVVEVYWSRKEWRCRSSRLKNIAMLSISVLPINSLSSMKVDVYNRSYTTILISASIFSDYIRHYGDV